MRFNEAFDNLIKGEEIAFPHPDETSYVMVDGAVFSRVGRHEDPLRLIIPPWMHWEDLLRDDWFVVTRAGGKNTHGR